ncbi:hypothetical protein [Actinokineospora sp. NBRC 105648]|uniref:hypothetical protein n=1 Tax=Actinokineospora sp. NBRC 105648 TaxID=3032206 RepID=UPI0024A3638E|nr:hypothetical protein [Actinokineospora sp. NBRC 105648]GLZ40795.1 hypothetical protein Acsp05_44190 [Actinokineospora sp. NBRC 105648]
MRRRFPSPTTGGALSAAGWLFAELAMVLVIVAVGSEATPPQRAAAVPTTTPPSTPPPTPGAPEGLALTSRKFTMGLPADDREVLDSFVRELNAIVAPQGKVGLILLFGTSRNANAPAQGTRLSERLKGVVQRAGIPQLRSVAEIRPYFGGDGGPGTVTVELFLLNGTT